MNTDKIRDLCKKHRISLKELSEKVGLSPNGTQHILRAGSTNTTTLEKIALELGVHPGYFFDDSPVKSDLYNVTKTPPIVTDSYPVIPLQNQSIMMQANETQLKYIKMLEDRVKQLEDTNDTLRLQIP